MLTMLDSSRSQPWPLTCDSRAARVAETTTTFSSWKVRSGSWERPMRWSASWLGCCGCSGSPRTVFGLGPAREHDVADRNCGSERRDQGAPTDQPLTTRDHEQARNGQVEQDHRVAVGHVRPSLFTAIEVQPIGRSQK